MVKKALVLADDNMFGVPIIRRSIKLSCLTYLKAALGAFKLYEKNEGVYNIMKSDARKFYLTTQIHPLCAPISDERLIGAEQYKHISDWFSVTYKEVKAGDVAGMLRRFGRWKHFQDVNDNTPLYEIVTIEEPIANEL